MGENIAFYQRLLHKKIEGKVKKNFFRQINKFSVVTLNQAQDQAKNPHLQSAIEETASQSQQTPSKADLSNT